MSAIKKLSANNVVLIKTAVGKIESKRYAFLKYPIISVLKFSGIGIVNEIPREVNKPFQSSKNMKNGDSAMIINIPVSILFCEKF